MVPRGHRFGDLGGALFGRVCLGGFGPGSPRPSTAAAAKAWAFKAKAESSRGECHTSFYGPTIIVTHTRRPEGTLTVLSKPQKPPEPPNASRTGAEIAGFGQLDERMQRRCDLSHSRNPEGSTASAPFSRPLDQRPCLGTAILLGRSVWEAAKALLKAPRVF